MITLMRRSKFKTSTVPDIIYVRTFIKKNILVYALNNGYIGSYEMKDQNYKVLYNKTDDCYFEIIG